MSNLEPANEFLAIFLEEALDILSDWERNCLALELSQDSDVSTVPVNLADFFDQ